MRKSIALLLVSIAAIACLAAATNTPRGVKTSSLNLYQGEYIECDGGKKVPMKRVNDNFCDCKDGLDEPGTSACPTGKFFCINQGFRGAYIPSSWVDDGRCDCCDGSDETIVKCENTCVEDAKKYHATIAEDIAVQERGLALRTSYIKHATNERERYRQLIKDAEAKMVDLEAKVSNLETIKIAAEEAYSNAYDKAQQTQQAQAQAETKTENADVDQENKQADEEAKKEEATVNVDDDEVVKPLKEAPKHKVVDYSSMASSYDEEEEDGVLFTFWQSLKAGYADLFDSIASVWFLAWNAAVSVTVPLTEKEKAVRDWQDATNERDTLKRELENYNKFMNLDFGPDLAYHALYGNTYEFADREYTYKLNGFNDVQQSKPGHSSTLGRWKGWDESKPNVMRYEQGDRCWGAPDRSTIVTLVCGDEHKILDVKEPNKCEYTMTIKTPAACSQAALDALRNGE